MRSDHTAGPDGQQAESFCDGGVTENGADGQRPIMFQDFCVKSSRVVQKGGLNKGPAVSQQATDEGGPADASSRSQAPVRGQEGQATAAEKKSENSGVVGAESAQAFFERVWPKVPERVQAGQGSASEGLPPALCITGGMTRQNQSGEVETGGEDTVEIAIFGGWQKDRFVLLAERLDELRASSEAGSEGVLTVGADELVVKEHGAKLGVYFRWLLEADGCTIAILNRSVASDKTPAVRVAFGSLALMTLGLDELWVRTCDLLGRMGFTMHFHKLSRVDPCVDLPGQAAEPFVEAGIAWRFVSKGRRGGFHYAGVEEWEGWSHGTGPVHMRVYDKLREVLAKQDWMKLAILRDKRWGGVVPERATRVEFQLRRETLRDRWQVDTIDDYKRKRRQIVEWLTHEWMRIVVERPDRENRNQTRVETAPLWVMVQQAFFAWVGKNTIPRVLRREVLRPAVVALGKQMSGVLTTIYASLGRKPASMEEFMAEGAEILKLYGQQAYKAAEVKLKLFEARKAAMLIGQLAAAG